MKISKILLLWTLTIVFCFTIYSTGHSTYYCYQNKGGLAFNYEGYRGEATIKWSNLYDREKCYYVGTSKKFDKQPATRKSFIVLLLGLSTFSTLKVRRKSNDED